MAFTIGLLVGKKGKRKKKQAASTKLLWEEPTYVEEPRKEEVEEKEEEGAYYARTILTKVSHRAPLGRRDQTIVPPCASRARACSRRLSYLYVCT